jgi:preprotein translocase SecE subunit
VARSNRKRAKDRRPRAPQPVPSAANGADDGAPNPIAHATPDAELAEAQLALGRPELTPDAGTADEPEPQDGGQELDPTDEELDDAASLETLPAESSAAPPAHRQHAFGRLITFVQGSWRELQRVQWPDRRQVMQATGVVLGFVIVAGMFLGVADFLSGHVVNYVLYGHWK